MVWKEPNVLCQPFNCGPQCQPPSDHLSLAEILVGCDEQFDL